MIENGYKLTSDGYTYKDIYEHISGIDSGYYYLTATIKYTEESEVSYLYAKGDNEEVCRTAIPLSENGTVVTVRGIYVGNDGEADIGILVNLNEGSCIEVSNIELTLEANQESKYEGLFGVDISKLTWEEDEGAVYYDENKNAVDPVELFHEYNISTVKLELHNSPGKGNGDGEGYLPEYYQTEEDIINLAKRASEYDMKILLAFSYSDYWGNEAIPSEWKSAIENMSEEDAVAYLETAVYEYTKDVLNEMKNNDVLPEYVALGGEIQGGILLPYGSYI